jgi:carbohydrate kinase (thermoresistant glucokinase family)
MPDTWLPSLVTSTPQAGFELVVKLSRMDDEVTQPLDEIRARQVDQVRRRRPGALRPRRHDPGRSSRWAPVQASDWRRDGDLSQAYFRRAARRSEISSDLYGSISPMTISVSPRLTTPRNETPRNSQQGASASGDVGGVAAPVVVVIMGVSGCGKTTVAAMLAGRLHWRFEEGDNLHSAANIVKMSRGVPLTDDDRWPWLRAIADVISGWIAEGHSGVVACSALKRAYRRIIIDDNPAVRLVYLKGSRELMLRRMAARHGHFMPVSLLDSQFETLEEPTSEEAAVVISIDQRPEEIVTEIAAAVSAS